MSASDKTEPSRWAVMAAYGAVLSVLPSGVWRTSIGFGATLGTTAKWRAFQHVPGTGTFYVLFLTAVTIGAASMTFALVRPWGEQVPHWIPGLGGRTIPTWLPITVALPGSILVMVICAGSVLHWDHVIGFAGRPVGDWYALVVACYLPALAWGPCVLFATAEFWWRHRSSPSA